jgi:uncharacterized membrane protein (UPF0136 family)
MSCLVRYEHQGEDEGGVCETICRIYLLGIFLLAVRRRKPDYSICIALGGVLSVYVYITYAHRPSMPMSLTNILMPTCIL